MKTFARSTAVLMSLASSALLAQHTVLTGDTQINSGAATTNYAKSTTLQVGGAYSTLLMFDVSSMLPTGTTVSQVEHANLIIFPNTVTTAGSIKIDRVTSSWSETAVTYATKPTTTTTGESTVSISGADKYVQISLTGIVRSWVGTPSSNFGVELFSSGGNLLMDSKENANTSHNALLLITLSSPAGPAGPQGATGPTGPTGPKGATGATGPQGPTGTLNLPYYGSVATSGYAFEVGNTGASGDGLNAYGGTAGSFPIGGAGMVAQGGNSSTQPGSAGGLGIEAIGGDGYNDGAGNSEPGGTGAYLIGGDNGGYGAVAYGASGPGGVGLETYPGNDGGYAAELFGDVYVGGTLSKAGGSFKIDHPLDPENKYLFHSFVESPDMKNVYDGVVVTDGAGTAVVTLPDWFESLNRDFRYQLTVVGQFSQAIISSKVANNRFVIRTDKANVEVCWQVTGIRQDAWANAHRIPVEEEKAEAEKGHYLHPELFNHKEDAAIGEVHKLHPKVQQRR